MSHNHQTDVTSNRITEPILFFCEKVPLRSLLCLDKASWRRSRTWSLSLLSRLFHFQAFPPLFLEPRRPAGPEVGTTPFWSPDKSFLCRPETGWDWKRRRRRRNGTQRSNEGTLKEKEEGDPHRKKREREKLGTFFSLSFSYGTFMPECNEGK